MYEYSTQDTLLLKEYGRNVQKLVSYLLTIADRKERTEKAYILVELMKQIHPNYKEVQDIPNKFWDDLFIISRFQLDVESPFPMPEKEAIGKAPQKVAYSSNHIKFRHYGKNIQLLVQKTAQMPQDEKRKELEIELFKLVKAFYISWQKENVEDYLVIEHIKELSKQQIQINLEDVAESKSSSSYEVKNKMLHNNNNRFKNNKAKKNKNKNRNKNPNNNHRNINP
ncbi:MAG: DUF4290 domain-containing protein [Thermonemataceae bacterium]|nr:DUF4290 domain-containing protein [Thermonemataceae bacterium]